MTLDLDRYFARVGWTDPVPATMPTLAGLLRAHMIAIPFENVDVLLGKSPSLDLDDLQTKLVDAKRGGYCYEHATLFQAVLARLGFTVKAHSARVTMVGTKQTSPRTHMLLSVELPEGAFVVDPGFGGLAPLVPVPFDGVQVGDHWLERDAGDWVLKAHVRSAVINAWVTSMEEDFPIDFVMANHFTSTHPRSPFTQRLMARAFVVDGGDEHEVRISNRDLTVAGTPRKLADRADLHDALLRYFGFDLDVSGLRVPSVPEWV